MNNLFLVEPTCCKTIRDAILLLGNFGFQRGRFIVGLPKEWMEKLNTCFPDLAVIEKRKLMRFISIAIEQNALIYPDYVKWKSDVSWIENADSYYELSESIDAVVVNEREVSKDYHISLDDFLLEAPPTEECAIQAIPSEFRRVTEILLKNSPEVLLVDPFFNPCLRSCEAVLSELFLGIKSGRCGSIKIFARNACDNPKNLTWEDIVKKLDAFLGKFKPSNKLQVTYILLDDHEHFDKMHGRYLFSKSGGVRVDQGFQTLPKQRETDVNPMAMKSINKYWSIYVFDFNNLNVAYSYSRRFDEVGWENSSS